MGQQVSWERRRCVRWALRSRESLCCSPAQVQGHERCDRHFAQSWHSQLCSTNVGCCSHLGANVGNRICFQPWFSFSKPGPPQWTPRLFLSMHPFKMPPLWQVTPPPVHVGIHFAQVSGLTSQVQFPRVVRPYPGRRHNKSDGNQYQRHFARSVFNLAILCLFSLNMRTSDALFMIFSALNTAF